MPRPKKTPDDIPKLYGLIKEDVSESIYHEYLKIIDAPPKLGAIVDVSENFLQCLELIKKNSWPEYKWLSRFIPVAKACACIPNPDTSQKNSEGIDPDWWSQAFKGRTEKGEDQIPSYNYQGEHPLYTVLCVMHDVGDWEWAVENFRFLQMHLLCAYKDWDGLNKTVKEKNFLGKMYRGMRTLSDTSGGRGIELKILSDSPTDFIHKITNLNTLTVWQLVQFKRLNVDNLAKILNSLLRMRGLRSKRTGGGGGGKKNNFGLGVTRQIYSFNLVGSGPRLRDMQIDQEDDEVFTVEIEEEEVEVADTDDVSPYETQADKVGLDTPSSKEQRAGGWRSKYQLKHLLMANQELPFTFNQFIIPEIALLMESLGRRFRESIKQTERIIDSLEQRSSIDNVSEEEVDNLERSLKPAQFAVIAMMQVWLGRTSEEAMSIVESQKDSISEGVIQLLRKGGVSYWRFPVQIPDSHADRTALPNQERTAAGYMRLPDYFGFSEYFRKLRKTCERIEMQHPFGSWNRQDYKQCYEDTLEDIKENHGKLISKSSTYLSRFLVNELLKQGSDSADAALICGRKLPNAFNQLHYYCPDVAYLASAYETTVQKVIERVYENWPVPVKAKKVKKVKINNMSGAVGVKQCPTVQAVSQMVLTLQEKIKSTELAPDQSLKIRDRIERHNYFVAYTVLYSAYTTSYRALNQPLPRAEWMDGQGDFFALSDKDGLVKGSGIDGQVEVIVKKPKSFFNTRHIPLNEGLKRQLENWDIHRSRIKEIGFLDELRMTRAERRILQSGQPFYLDRDPNIGLVLIPSFPSRTEQQVAGFFDFAINSNRRFLRTELRMKGVPAEYVNAFMSHWSMGQQPWGQYSSFPILDYRRTITQAIEELSLECGWRPIDCPFRTR